MENKKSQEAIEFLMTYGWAILSAVICIFVLIYFGYFSNHDNFTPCLEKFAKEYCDNNNFIYINNSLVNRDINSFFDCYTDSRTREKERFYFLNEEIEECNGKQRINKIIRTSQK